MSQMIENSKRMKVVKSFTIDVDLMVKVQRYARLNDMSLSEAIRELAALGYTDHEKRGEWLR